MISSLWNWLWKLDLMGMFGISVLQVFALTISEQASAQITPDTTLGTESSVVTPNNVVIPGLPSDAQGQELKVLRIDGGAIRGSNLFHSFQEFNLGEGRGVYFTNPQGIENILSRVTGANRSEILGRLGVLGNANLFLLNPNGIVFGKNASLDVEGSFVATTANAIRLGNTGLFSASEPASSNLLSINPSALFYNVLANEAAIVNRSVKGLDVLEGRSLLLVGGKITLESGVIRVPGGRAELGGLDSPGNVALSKDGNNLGLSFPDGVQRADVLLTKSSSGSNGSEVNVRTGGNGSIAINARDVEMNGGSVLRGGIQSRLGSVDAVAGDITLNATGTIEVKQQSAIENIVGTGAIGNAGKISITTGSLSVKDGSQILARTFGQGDAGRVKIHASDTLTLSALNGNGQPTIGSDVVAGSSGNGNDVEITAGKVNLNNNAIVAASILNGTGKNGQPAQAGNVKIKASEQVVLDNSYIYSEVGKNSFGNGGIIEITAPQVSLENQAQLITRVQSGGNGNGGDININTGSLSVKDGGRILARTYGQGDAGKVKIQASDTVTLSALNGNGQPTIGSDVVAGSSGNGNDVEITVGKVNLNNNAIVAASILNGTGKNGQPAQAGNVKIKASEAVVLDNSYIYSEVGKNSFGNGGIIEITAPQVSLENQAQLITQVQSGGNGNGGDINITTGSLLNLNDHALLTSQSQGTGRAGNIIISSPRTLNVNNSKITTAAQQSSGGAIAIKAGDIRLYGDSDITTNVASGTGNGGDITLSANSIIAFGNSDILAFARDGKGGNIRFNTPAFFGQNYKPARANTDPSTLDQNNRVDINASGAVSGVITLPDTSFIQNSLNQLPQNLIDTAALVASSCVVRSNKRNGTFFITGKAGLPIRPGDAVASVYSAVDVQAVPDDTSATKHNHRWKIGDPIVEPTGVYRLENGQHILSRECGN